jgi:hypothetical protein
VVGQGKIKVYMNKEIIELLKERLEKGKREYNEELNPFDGRVWEIEALEEILDGMIYTATSILKIIHKKKLNGKPDRKYSKSAS